MEGRWHGQPYFDYSKKQWLITFEVDATPSVYDQTKDRPLDIDIKEHRKKRSLSANAYFHALVGKIADVLKVSHTEIHNKMIADYGQYDEEVGHVILKDSIPWEKLENIHVKPTTNTRVLDDGQLYRVYLVMRGSHTYDTKEMARLIDGVVSEAKELGIETLSPDELERLKQQWKAY